MSELFTEDGVMTGNKGSARGRAALRDAVTAVWAAEPPHTLHLTLNVTIDESGPDPSVRSVMLMVTRESPPRVLGSALVRQVVRRTAEGGGSPPGRSKVLEMRQSISDVLFSVAAGPENDVSSACWAARLVVSGWSAIPISQRSRGYWGGNDYWSVDERRR